MNYNTNINWNRFKKEVDLIYNDQPALLKNFIPNPEELLSWKDVEINLNSHQSVFEIIGDQSKIEVPTIPTRFGENQQDKKFIQTNINQGETFVIIYYSMFNPYARSLCKEIEEMFPVTTDIHVYGSKGSSSTSFPHHYDHPANFIIQTYGECDWKVFSNSISSLFSENNITPDASNLSPMIETTLSPGDMLYIPPRFYHAAFPNQPRLSASIPCAPGTRGRFDKNYYKI